MNDMNIDPKHLDEQGNLLVPCQPDGEPDFTRMARLFVEEHQLVVFHPSWEGGQRIIPTQDKDKEVLRRTYLRLVEEQSVEAGKPFGIAVVNLEPEAMHAMIDMVMSGAYADLPRKGGGQ